MTLNEGGVLYESLEGVCWSADDDTVGKFCYGVYSGDDDQLMLGHLAAYFEKDGLEPLTMFLADNVGATYEPEMECDTYDPSTDCYKLKGGNTLSAEWYQPKQVAVDEYVDNFRLSAGM